MASEPMAHREGWLAIRVELLRGGHSGCLWPPPGRDLAVGPKHSFAQLAASIDQAFARWDLSHLHTFDLPDGRLVAEHAYIAEGCEDDPPAVLDTELLVTDAVDVGQEFTYVFDLGDCWTHRCTVLRDDVDPLDELGILADQPAPYWGWGIIPDQYGRLWSEDNGEDSPPAPPAELAGFGRQPNRIIAITEPKPPSPPTPTAGQPDPAEPHRATFRRGAGRQCRCEWTTPRSSGPCRTRPVFHQGATARRDVGHGTAPRTGTVGVWPMGPFTSDGVLRLPTARFSSVFLLWSSFSSSPS